MPYHFWANFNFLQFKQYWRQLFWSTKVTLFSQGETSSDFNPPTQPVIRVTQRYFNSWNFSLWLKTRKSKFTLEKCRTDEWWFHCNYFTVFSLPFPTVVWKVLLPSWTRFLSWDALGCREFSQSPVHHWISLLWAIALSMWARMRSHSFYSQTRHRWQSPTRTAHSEFCRAV